MALVFQLQRAIILGSYLLVAIELAFLPIPSEASTVSLLSKRRSAQRVPPNDNAGEVIGELSGFFLYLSVVATIVGIFFFLLPLVFSVYPDIRLSLLPIGGNTSDFVKILSIMIITVGSAISLVGVLQLRASLHRRDRVTRLRTDGLFSLSRNASLLGVHVSGVGYILAVPSWLLIIGFVVYVFNAHQRVLVEEAHLERRYGTEYRDYKEKVGRYVRWL